VCQLVCHPELMSRLPSYLWRNRLGIFYVRLLVPQDILELAPKLPADIRRSLHTRDASLALRQALPLAANWHRFVDDMRAMKKPAVEPSQLLLEDSAGRQWKLSREPGESKEDYAIAVESAVRGLTVDDIVATCNTPPARRNFAFEETEPRKAARSEKLDAWLFDVSMEYGKSQIKIGKFKEASWIKSQEPALRLFRELASVETRQVQWEGKTIEIEDLRCGDITVDLLQKYAEDLNTLPAHAGQSNRIARATNPFAPSFKAALRNPDGKPPASPVTIGNKLDFLSAFLTWASDRGHVLEVGKLRRILATSKNKSSSDGYSSFEPEDIRLIFSSAQFRKAEEPWQYWIPVLGLFTAGRINEIAQLQVNDFGDYQGHYCVCFTDEDTHASKLPTGKKVASSPKGLKTAAAKRYILNRPGFRGGPLV
jgi:hypothetical protein